MIQRCVIGIEVSNEDVARRLLALPVRSRVLDGITGLPGFGSDPVDPVHAVNNRVMLSTTALIDAFENVARTCFSPVQSAVKQITLAGAVRAAMRHVTIRAPFVASKSMTLLEYKYRTSAGAGWVRVNSSEVTTSFRSSGTNWEQSLPLQLVLPYPIRSKTIPSACWICIPLGILGIWGGITEILAGGEQISVFVALVMLIFGWLHRTEEWIVFPSTLDSCRVQFARQCGDRNPFDEFTTQLTARIQSARREVVRGQPAE